jgi:hypothetical protein
VVFCLILSGLVGSLTAGARPASQAAGGALLGRRLAATSVGFHTVPSATTKHVGDEFDVQVLVDASSDMPVQSVDMHFTWDPTYLLLLSKTQGSTFALVARFQQSGNDIWYAAGVDPNPVTAPTLLFTVRFRALAVTPSTPLTFVTPRAVSGEEDNFTEWPVTPTHGQVTIIGDMATPTNTATQTHTPSTTPSPTQTHTPSRTATLSATPRKTPKDTKIPKPTKTPTVTRTATLLATSTSTPTKKKP